jgi:hypothetical protein
MNHNQLLRRGSGHDIHHFTEQSLNKEHSYSIIDQGAGLVFHKATVASSGQTIVSGLRDKITETEGDML